MAFGFKRIHDFSPLSLKNLNDQLESMWFKVMGGISQRDINSEFSSVIESKVGEDNFASVLEQNSDAVIMAVGKTGGDNLIKNGNCYFKMDSWLFENAHVNDEGFNVLKGYLKQIGIRVTPNAEYTLGFELKSDANINVKVMGLNLANQLYELPVFTKESTKEQTFTFTIPSAISYISVEFSSLGDFTIRKIYLREGKGVIGYSDNPNELYGSGLFITENGVNISTKSFNLEVKDENGNLKSILSTDGAGFDNILCSNVTINNQSFLSGPDTHIYVNSIMGNDNNDGKSTYTPFKTIARALKSVPYHITSSMTIHLSGGEYYENIVFAYGGSGNLTILGEDGTLRGQILLQGCFYNLTINSLKIVSDEDYGIYCDGNGFLNLHYCIINCSKQTGTKGIYIKNGYTAYLKESEIHNCNYAIYISHGATAHVADCKGKNNDVSYYVTYMGLINCNGTIPSADVYNYEVEGGRQVGTFIGTDFGENYETPGEKIKLLTLNPSLKLGYDKGEYVESLWQGENKGIVFSFDTKAIKDNLINKTIKDIKLYIKRSEKDEDVKEKTLRAFCHNIKSEDDEFSLYSEYGAIAKIKKEEEIFVSIPLSFIENVLLDKVCGIAFFNDNTDEDFKVCLSDEYSTRLEVAYV